MKLGMNHPMGPLALADLIGLDTCLAIMETLYDGFNDSKYRPCPLLRKYVEAGWLSKVKWRFPSARLMSALGPMDSLHFNSGIQHQHAQCQHEDAEMMVVIYNPCKEIQ
jgi:3-hydroxyacyl-CoA dehydrogenase